MEGKRDNGEKRGKCHQGACIKDSWTKPKGIGSWVGGRDGWDKRPWWCENVDDYS